MKEINFSNKEDKRDFIKYLKSHMLGWEEEIDKTNVNGIIRVGWKRIRELMKVGHNIMLRRIGIIKRDMLSQKSFDQLFAEKADIKKK